MPYVLDRNPCGSSSGSGVVAAADLAVAAVGTETDGSIVCPSGANGVVGIKPTVGLWSRAGVIPISADQDTAGPMARNVTDAAVLLGAATGVDPADAATAEQVGHAFTNYTTFLDDDALAGARIGVWRAGTYDPSLVGPVVEPILDDVIDALEDEGATVIDGTDIDLSATANEFPALLCEFKTDIATYLQTYVHGTNPKTPGRSYPQTLAELIAFNQRHPRLEGPWNDAVFVLAEATNGRRDAACAALRESTTPPVQDAIDELMADNDLDAIIGLTNGPAWPTNDDPAEGDLDGHFEFFVGSSGAAAVSGYAVHHGARRLHRGTAGRDHVHRRPVGRTGAARPCLRLRAGDAGRVPPQFIPTIGDELFPGVPNPPDLLRTQRQQGPRVSPISSCASGRDSGGDNEARPVGRASCG